MKPNEPKSSAAAACPASARNTRERERARQEREGGRKNKMREIEWRVQKTGLKSMWAIATPQPPFSLFHLLLHPLPFHTFFFFYKAFISSLLLRWEEQEKKKPKGVLWLSSVPVLLLLLLLQNSTFHSPFRLRDSQANHAVNN